MKTTMMKEIARKIALREEQAAAIREAAAKTARSSAASNLPADDLTAIKGIGAAVAAKLEAAGIRHYESLAATTDEALDAVAKGTAKKAAKGEWRAQAETLAAEKEPVEMPEVDLGLAGRISGRDLWAALDLDGSDIDNAKRMLARYEGKLIYVSGLGTMAWTGKRWKLEEKDDAPLGRAAQTTAEAINFEAAIVRIAHEHGIVEHYCTSKKDAKEARELLNGQDVVFCHEEIAARAMKAKDLKAVNAMGKIATDHMQVEQKAIDAQKHLLTVANGTINLITGEVIKSEPDHLITKMTPLSVPTIEDHEGRRWVAFDPAACPVWLKAISQAFLADKDLIDYVQRLVGYLITGETTEQKFFFASGRGSNMKGRFFNTVASIIPEHIAEVEKDLLMKQRGGRKEMGGTNEAVADLRGARVIHAEEGDLDDVLDEAVMKLLSGGGVLKAAKKYKSEIKFKPEGKIFYETNNRPSIYSQDKAIWRRVVDIPFRAHFANPNDEDYEPGVSLPKNERLDEQLAAELPAILAWAVMGARVWYEKGLSREIPEPAAIVKQRKTYKTETDVLADFIDDACEREDSKVIAAGQLYQAYENHCRLNANGRPISSKAFSKALDERGFGRFKRGGQAYRDGLTLNEAGWAYHRDERPKDHVALKAVAPEPVSAVDRDMDAPLRSYGVNGRLYLDRRSPVQRSQVGRDDGSELPGSR
ncbi:P4 family phage/plasmid primase-like protein [Limimaricola variabilis]|uniref:P4 family phage/plasmid primase-like protein n=1 Tax=Limimaricola variabilis TaxID=1492771 RepID=A0ABR6HMN4_9RHOB|nr:phage/plasmid primase, P4 family [Limimaricola variabilis]MBB3711747.1 P4 family phage/plasmid primase-like protein [Limimaricola variabilis]